MPINLITLLGDARQKLKTIRDLLRFSVSVFEQNDLYYGHGTTNSYDEAVYLILHTLSLPIDLPTQQFDLYLDSILLDDEIKAILAIIEKRAKEKIPAPYLTHEAICQGYSFYVDERVIIPRSFLAEIMVNDQLQPWIEHPELVNNLLDLCTGSGALAIIAANHFYDSSVVASDINASALEVAKINVEKYGLEDRIDLVKSNLFAKLSKYKGKFDLILTNPPYVDAECMNALTPEYLHEPQIALSGGDDGLELIDVILTEAKHYLTDFGILVVEMGDNKYELIDKYPNLPFTWLETQSSDGFVFVLTRKDLETL